MGKLRLQNWETIQLGDAASFINGYAFKPKDWKTDGLEIIRIQNLTKGNSSINYYDGELKDRFKVVKGDFLISWSATLGIYTWTGDDAWLNQHIFKVVFDKKEFDKSYFKHLIAMSLEEMGRETHGSTMKHITKPRFDSFKITYPPLAEQQKIAAILDAADSLRQKDRQLIDHYTTLSQSLFLEMFGDVFVNEREFTKQPLKMLSEKVQIGPFGSQLHQHDYIDNGTPLINPIHIVELKIVPNFSFTLSKEKYGSLPNYHLKTNDIIMARRGEMGRCALVTEKENNYFCGTGSLFIRPNNAVNSLFLLHVLSGKSGRSYLERNSQGVTMMNLNKKIILNLEFGVPHINSQNKFAESIKLIEAQKKQAQASLEKSEALFNSLLQRAFTGELTDNLAA